MILCVIGFLMALIIATYDFIENLKGMKEYNKDINHKIQYDIRNWEKSRTYNKRDLRTVPKLCWDFVWFNVVLDLIVLLGVFVLSMFVYVGCAMSGHFQQPYDYSFNINAFQDNMVTQGNIHGGAFCIRGSVDGELSYFFSRDTNKGETVGHIPANYSYIKYSDDIKPNITVHKTKDVYPKWLMKVFFYIGDNDQLDYYQITIPAGSNIVDGTYQIDMQ